MTDLTMKIPILLVIAGGLLQWIVRANRTLDDRVYAAWAVGLCSLVYAVAHVPVGTWNQEVVSFLEWLGSPGTGALFQIAGGTAVVSYVANIATKVGANPAHVAIPVTDSK